MAAPRPSIDPIFFASPAEFRAWLEASHASARELWVGFHKKGTGRPSLTWPESVAEALCFGWIDGVRRRLDDERYMIRFTPRRPGSTWSAINVTMMERLIAAGRVHPAGLHAYSLRAQAKSGIYSYEQRHRAELDADMLRQFQRNRRAWAYFQARPPGYRRTATWWVVSAKRAETRAKRLAQLIASSAREQPIPLLARPGDPTPSAAPKRASAKRPATRRASAKSAPARKRAGAKRSRGRGHP